MKQITSSCAGLDCVTPQLPRDVQKNLRDFPYFHFPPVEPGWALSRCALPSAPRKERTDSPAPAHGTAALPARRAACAGAPTRADASDSLLGVSPLEGFVPRKPASPRRAAVAEAGHGPSPQRGYAGSTPAGRRRFNWGDLLWGVQGHCQSRRAAKPPGSQPRGC